MLRHFNTLDTRTIISKNNFEVGVREAKTVLSRRYFGGGWLFGAFQFMKLLSSLTEPACSLCQTEWPLWLLLGVPQHHRRGAWVISRVFDSGYPWDMVFMCTISEHIQKFSSNSYCELVDSKKDEQLVQSCKLWLDTRRQVNTEVCTRLLGRRSIGPSSNHNTATRLSMKENIIWIT